MISAVIFDLDGTLTKVPSPWRYVHERLGVWETLACSYFDEWMSGRITYEEFCRRDAGLWNGCSLDEIYSYLDEIELNRHVPAVIDALTAAADSLHHHFVRIQIRCCQNTGSTSLGPADHLCERTYRWADGADQCFRRF